MPTDTVKVYTVEEHADPRGFSVFVVNTSGPVVTTTNALAASLCDRARTLEKRIALTWRQEGWGVKKGRLVDVHLEAA